MDRKPDSHRRENCAVCGVKIPRERRAEMPTVSTCLPCQQRRESGDAADDDREEARSGASGASYPADRETVYVRGNLVVSGDWSGNLVDLLGREREVRRLLDTHDPRRARMLVQALPVEEQAALVAMSEDPEAMLSMTGADSSGVPGYSPEVVELLPADTLGNLISINPDERKFNTTLIRAMSPDVLRSTMAETLDRVDNPGLRTQVSWEWLQALATLSESDRRAELLRAVDPAHLEDALLDRLEHLKLNEVVGFAGFQVYRFRLFSTEGLGGTRPSAFVEDPETGIVLDALYEAAPAVLSEAIRGAWERSAAENEEENTGQETETKQADIVEQSNEPSDRR